ncbi:flagellin N-terminal helical domain-containing protein [Comamonas jiangduensis]|uniref:flagellin N-terminal helical domain-containing protein n=1 Tax=Comamonas jiangduensis TaxID=1194168 RepID=UPI0028AB7BF2|nr:flagellin [Comamonas jiangduensis]
MALTINTNVVSINAQRNLSLSGSQLGTAMQRLSSGLRVNSAKDDAAGLAIAERMNAQSKGLAVAARNANDGISLAQTAEGSLGKVGDMLQRMRELAVQASNATNSSTDRAALQAEVSQLVSEIDRVAKTSAFNGQKLLEGSFAGAVFQVGASAGDNITVGSLVNATASELASVDYYRSTAAVAATSLVQQTFDTATPPAVNAAGFDSVIAAGNLLVNGISLGEIAAANSGAERIGQVVAAINAKTADHGVTAFYEDGKFELRSDKTGITLTDSGTAGIYGWTSAATGLTTAIANTTLVTAADATTSTSAAKGLNTLSVNTQSDAWLALKKIDKAIDQINSSRGDLGALQTRFEKTVENIDIMNENISAARGRIVDADFAAETASLSRTQILQQAGTAMVAQANQLSQGVLSLLQ